MSLCNYCEYRNLYDCEDGYDRSENCYSFKLDSETEKRKLRKF